MRAQLRGRSGARRRAIVLGTTRSALSAVRDLAAGGWDVAVAHAPTEAHVACASRYATGCHLVTGPQDDPEAFASDLARVAEETGADVVLPAADDYLAGVSLARDAIPAAVPLASHAAVMTVLDKIDIETVARDAGFAVPGSVIADDGVVAGWDGPALVKNRSHWTPGYSGRRIEAEHVTDGVSLRRAVDRIRDAGGCPILQVPAGGRMHGATAFRAPDGVVSGHVHQTSDHLWPTPAGTTSRAVTSPVDRGLADRVAALLDRLDWIGPAMLQLFRQPDGTDLVIDVNGRFHHSLALSTAAGVHLPRAWARAGLGESVHLPDATVGVMFSCLVGDTRRAMRERRGGVVRDVSTTVGVALRARHTYLSVRDPRPGVHYVREASSRRRSRQS